MMMTKTGKLLMSALYAIYDVVLECEIGHEEVLHTCGIVKSLVSSK